MRQSFKFQLRNPKTGQLDVRRVAVPVPPPSWDEFVSLLEHIYDENFHRELVIQYRDDEGEIITVSSQLEWTESLNILQDQKIVRIFLSERKGPLFKDSPPPVVERFYETVSNQEKAPEIPQSQLNELALSVPKVLASLFGKGGKILPFNIPEWLRDAVNVKVDGSDDYVDLDIDIEKLYKVISNKSIEYLNNGFYDNGKKLLESLLVLNDSNPLTLYNLACAESLKGEVNEALEHLRRAINNGYNDLNHLLQDSDFENIKLQPEFRTLVAYLRDRLCLFDTPSPSEADLEKPAEPSKIITDCLPVVTQKEVEENEQESDDIQSEFEFLFKAETKPESENITVSDSDSDSESESEAEESEEEGPEIIDVPSAQDPDLKTKLQILTDMGFPEVDINEILLREADGNLDVVIANLLQNLEN